jgi:hypothetical protein
MNMEEARGLLASAHERLARGEWQKAREAFETVRVVVEEPEVLEGLAMAAWWLDDADAVFEARAPISSTAGMATGAAPPAWR